MSSENLVGKTLGKYELREFLGRGGMGEVYRAFQSDLNREVALKVLRSDLTSDREYVSRFRREATTAAALEHPHIIHIYDSGSDQGVYYIAMPWLTGGTLSDRLEKNVLSAHEMAALLKQLAGALAYAHSHDVIHRDVKPGNVMFDADGRAYLMDFGIARPMDATRLTTSGVAVGTPAYMPPEQSIASVLTPAADQYALAVLVYETMTGYLPFQAPTPLPEAIIRILKRALAKEADLRFSSVTAFARAFESAAAESGNADPFLFVIPMSGRDEDLREVNRLLKSGPVAIVGVGGLGKSRLAAEVVLTNADVDGAIWHRVNEFSYPDALIELLRRHFGLDSAASREEAIEPLRMHKRLIVIDNAESISVERRPSYVELIGELVRAGALLLLTNRAEWRELEPLGGKTHTLERLSPDAAAQVVMSMIDVWGAPPDVRWHAETLAQAARFHPWMIEWAVRQTLKREVSRVIQVLEELKSQRAQDALFEIIGKTLRQMTDESGPDAESALKRLAVTRGGFTYSASDAIVQAEDPDDLDDWLETLQDWQFVTMHLTSTGRRYDIDPLVVEAVGADENAHRSHFTYYLALVERHEKTQDYASLDVESANVEAAFEWAIGTGDGPTALELAGYTVGFLGNRGRFEQRLDWIQRTAAALANHPDPKLQALAQHTLGYCYVELLTGDRRDHLLKAIAAYESALVYRKPESVPLEYATTQNNLGIVYLNLADIEDREANLRRAVECYQEALGYRQPEINPIHYATTQTNLGLAYHILSELEDQPDNLRRAIECYETALVSWPETTPLYRATTLNNLGAAYLDLSSIEDRAGNLRRTIAAFEAALVYRTPDLDPIHYADTRNNLGEAYQSLSEVEDQEGNLRRAIECYEAALIYYQPEAVPLGYAMTQNNLGKAYRSLSELEDRTDNLRRATAAFEAALIYRTPQTAPLEYARTQSNLGEAQRALDDLPAAVACWREAEKFYRQMGYPSDADEMLCRIADLEAGL